MSVSLLIGIAFVGATYSFLEKKNGEEAWGIGKTLGFSNWQCGADA